MAYNPFIEYVRGLGYEVDIPQESKPEQEKPESDDTDSGNSASGDEQGGENDETEQI